MARTLSEVEKGLSLVAVDNVPEKEADDIIREVRLKFTSERGPTLLGASQGEHATAYALYVEFTMRMVGSYIAAAHVNDYQGISDFLEEMISRPRKEQHLLTSFGFPSSTLDEFQKLLDVIKKLQTVSNQRVHSIAKNISAMSKLKDQVLTSELPKQVIDGINELNPDVLRQEIRTIREEYFFTIAQKISEAYLLFQNKSLHVTFRKVPGAEVDKGEGARIAGSLAKLRSYNESARSSTTSAGSSSSSQALPEGTGSSTIAHDSVSEIVENINNLLFYPKVVEDNIAPATRSDESKGVLRSNDKNLFGFVIARHLSIIFATFEEFEKNLSIKKKIIQEFILLRSREWGFDVAEKDALKEKIVAALEASETASYDSDSNISVSMGLGRSPSSALSPSSDELQSRLGITPPIEPANRTPLYQAGRTETPKVSEEEEVKPPDVTHKKPRGLDS